MTSKPKPSTKKITSGHFPEYLPAYLYPSLLLRKIYRQTWTRLQERQASQLGGVGIEPEGEPQWPTPAEIEHNPIGHINKCRKWIDDDFNNPQVKIISDAIENLKKNLGDKNLRYCSAAGTFVPATYNDQATRNKHWENCWVLAHCDVQPGQKILDIGGASTIFSFYLASIGCDVIVIDNDWGNCGTIYNANYVAKKMKWKLKTLDRDIDKGIPYENETFDRIFSICVIEHLPSTLRRFMMKEINRTLKPGGRLGMTTDYDVQRKTLTTDKGLRFGYIQKIKRDVIEPSGLQLYGNHRLLDAFKPEENFMGSLFFQKPIKQN